MKPRAKVNPAEQSDVLAKIKRTALHGAVGSHMLSVHLRECVCVNFPPSTLSFLFSVSLFLSLLGGKLLLSVEVGARRRHSGNF